jgi:hypothetical protein
VGYIFGGFLGFGWFVLYFVDLCALVPTVLGIVFVGYIDNVFMVCFIVVKYGYVIDVN